MTAWGKLIATTGSLANTVGANQPFRYRGYVYDEETGWYYLQSRYYDPTTCRFISADVLLSTGQGVIGHNSFAYCGNNPICNIDSQGSFSWSNIFSGAELLAIGVAAVCTALTVVSCGTAAPLVVAVAAVTFAAGGMTIINGASEVIEGVTATSETSNDGYNPMRDTVLGGNRRLYETQRDVLATVAEVGTTVLNVVSAVKGPMCFPFRKDHKESCPVPRRR